MDTRKPSRESALTHTIWRASRRSAGNGNCLEVAQQADHTQAVRDSKCPSSPVLTFPGAAWSRFLALSKPPADEPTD
ncbi:DUF397 domain-containing protein [Streptomyces sp. NPDC049881]|uniref:DUF397 domain-containing protein n=1 Tax=Streptomyces sp. NPDC049881 TaxID=3155778 RepID=UPI0034283F61